MPAIPRFNLFDSLLLFRIVHDAGEELEYSLDIGRVNRIVPPQHTLVQVDNGSADLCVGFRRAAWQHVRFDAGKQISLLRLAGKISQSLPAGDVVGHHPLDRAHGAAGIGRSFGYLLRVDCAIQHAGIFVQSAPGLAEDRANFSFELLRRQHSHQAQVVEFRQSLWIAGRSA